MNKRTYGYQPQGDANAEPLATLPFGGSNVYAGPKYDGMPAPPSLKDRIAALRKDPEVLAFLREFRATEYHWIAERGDGAEPITGGHHDNFGQIREECEFILANMTTGPFATVRAIHIIDALGAVVWSYEKPPAEPPPAA